MSTVERTLRIEAGHHGRIDRFVQSMTELTRSGVRALFAAGCVSLNGKRIAEDFTRVKEGDLIAVRSDPHRRYVEPAKPWHDSGFKIVHEDKDVIVVNKAAFVLTVPTGERSSDSLMDRVAKYLAKGGKDRQRAFAVHRLDRGVSGLLVIAKSEEMMRQLRDQFAERKPRRLYVGIVAGLLDKPQGTFESYLATAVNLDRYSTDDEGQGQHAITHYRVQKLLTKADATLVNVELETGRRNQIRVHFAEDGHPILGDPRYGKGESSHPMWNARRIALHAAMLGFDHPSTGEPMHFEAVLPFEMAKFVRFGA
jgi:23S rRNA pseudouridine1911/1915/1917 synthase